MGKEPHELPLPRKEFIFLMALLMAMGAIAVDMLLPTLAQIRTDFALENANGQQMVVYVYVAGLGIAQLFFGPLSDHFGRRPILLISVLGYVISAFLCALAAGFSLLLLARFSQGVFASGTRVVAMSIIRDVSSGDRMAQLVSVILTIYLFTPMIAPISGQYISLFWGWELVFYTLSFLAFLIFLWVLKRLPETRPSALSSNSDIRKTLSNYVHILSSKQTLAYLLAASTSIGGLYAVLSTSQQIFSDTFQQGHLFGVWFAFLAIFPIGFNLAVSRFVRKIGVKRLIYLTLAFNLAFCLLNIGAMHVTKGLFFAFLPLIAINFGFYAVLFGNFIALIMKPFGDKAGAAAGIYGLATTTLASGFGYLISSRFDGSIQPFLIGLLLLGLLSMFCMLLADTQKEMN